VSPPLPLPQGEGGGGLVEEGVMINIKGLRKREYKGGGIYDIVLL
jgi:hypothetical protein